MTQRYKIGDKVFIKHDKNLYTLTGYISDFGYSAQYTAIYNGKPLIIELAWLPDALIVEKFPKD
jgi:hypothetical protein